MIDHMAVMRRQIEEMQQKALEGRSIAEAMLAEVLAAVVEESEQAECFASSSNLARSPVVDNSAGNGSSSPDYDPPGSPEYIPPENDMETEVADTAQRYNCRLCGYISEGVIYQLYEHLEEEHGMEDAEEEELEKLCNLISSEQHDVGAEERENAVSNKLEEGLGAQQETCVEIENKEVDEGAKIANEHVDLQEQAGDQKEKVADLSEEGIEIKEKVNCLDEAKGDEEAIAKGERDDAENQEELENKQEGDPTLPSSSSVVSGTVSTIDELEVTFFHVMRSYKGLLGFFLGPHSI